MIINKALTKYKIVTEILHNKRRGQAESLLRKSTKANCHDVGDSHK